MRAIETQKTHAFAPFVPEIRLSALKRMAGTTGLEPAESAVMVYGSEVTV
jgi:hypothetical protein